MDSDLQLKASPFLSPSGFAGKMKPLLFSVVCLLPVHGNSATIASDRAANAAYSTGWSNGSNGGYGWGSSWTLNSSGPSGTFSAGTALTLQASTGTNAQAVRSFGGALGIGQTFSMDYYSGTLEMGSVAGFKLENASGSLLFEFDCYGGFTPSYTMTDDDGPGWKSANKTTQGIHIEFTLTGASSYTIAVNQIGSTTVISRSGNLIAAAGGTEISQFHLFFNGNAPSTTSNQQSFNNFAVVPEPSGIALLGMTGGLLLSAYRVRRRTN